MSKKNKEEEKCHIVSGIYGWNSRNGLTQVSC